MKHFLLVIGTFKSHLEDAITCMPVAVHREFFEDMNLIDLINTEV